MKTHKHTKFNTTIAHFLIAAFLSLALLPATASALAIGGIQFGGIIFYLSPDRQHGLIAETIDQGQATWYEAQNRISNPAKHSQAGKNYTDWRLPTKFELGLMYIKIGPGAPAPLTNAGHFAGNYWSSTEYDNDLAWEENLYPSINPHSGYYGSWLKNSVFSVRAVRSF